MGPFEKISFFPPDPLAVETVVAETVTSGEAMVVEIMAESEAVIGAYNKKP